MGSIPAFHTQASAEAEARLLAAMDERDRASSFLAALDALLESEAPQTLPAD